MVVYSFVAHWVWAEDGWLKRLGVHDFAGSGPVSLLGAVNGLLGIGFVGPRLGRFDGQRPAADFEPSSPPTVLFGLFMPRGAGGGAAWCEALVGMDRLQLRQLLRHYREPLEGDEKPPTSPGGAYRP